MKKNYENLSSLQFQSAGLMAEGIEMVLMSGRFFFFFSSFASISPVYIRLRI